MSAKYAALTGDLISSRNKGTEAVTASMAALKATADRLQRSYNRTVSNRPPLDLRFTRSRGDGWQVLLSRPELALVGCTALSASLTAANTGLNTRIAIGIGPIESAGTIDLSDANGPAFETAGDLLKQMTQSSWPARWTIGGSGVNDWQRAVIELAAWITQGWTPLQAEAVSLTVSDFSLTTNEARAEHINITRQAFEKRLKGAGIAHFATANNAFRNHFAESPK